MAVGFQAWEQDVEEPKADEKQGSEGLRETRAPQLTAYTGPAAVQEDTDADKREDGKECDREGQIAGIHHKVFALDGPVDCSHRPGHSDAQEDIHCIAACHIADTSVCVLVLLCSHLAGKSVCKREI